MKILYIPVTKKITEKNLKNFIKCFLYDIYIIIKNLSFKRKASNSTSGYIDAAIHSNAYVLELPYNFCIIFSKILNFLFDGIFVNWKFTNYRKDKDALEAKLIKISKKFTIKKVIVDARDMSTSVINDEILKGFDYVIKREKNKSISNNKYLSTILPCKLIDYNIYKNKEIISWDNIGNSKPNDISIYDIYFSGTQSSKYRNELTEFLKNKNYNFFGRTENSKIPFKQYLKTIYDSSINLALEGVGEFTFRHLEILSSCSFMLCENSINQLELPIPLIDGKHFVSFKDKEDLIRKIDFYLKNKQLRNEIALNGRKVLEKHYSPKRHGEFLINKIFQ